ncbi:MAG: fibronectin type III domain-containing protein [Thermoplasmatota archaeon]
MGPLDAGTGQQSLIESFSIQNGERMARDSKKGSGNHIIPLVAVLTFISSGLFLVSDLTEKVSASSADWFQEELPYQVVDMDISMGPANVPHLVLTTFEGGEGYSIFVGNRSRSGWYFEELAHGLGMISKFRIVVADDGSRHIVYQDEDQELIKYISDRSGRWRTETVFSEIKTLAPISLGLLSDGRVAVAFGNHIVAPGGVYFCIREDSKWYDTLVNPSGYVVDMEIDDNDNIHIVYNNYHDDHRVRYGIIGDSGAVYNTIEPMGSSLTQDYHRITCPDLEIDGNGRPHVLFMGTGDLHTNNTVIHCWNTTGKWEGENATEETNFNFQPRLFMDGSGQPSFLVINRSDTSKGYHCRYYWKEDGEWNYDRFGNFLLSGTNNIGMTAVMDDLDSIHMVGMEPRPFGYDEDMLYVVSGEKTSPSPPNYVDPHQRDGYIELEWKRSENDGGYPITEYQVFRQEPGGQMRKAGIFQVTEPTDVTSGLYLFEDHDVTVGLEYEYYIKAVNEIGTSGLSEPINVQVVSSPSPPRNLRATYGYDWINLTWDPPLQKGALPVLEYRIIPHSHSYIFVDGNLTYHNITMDRPDLLNLTVSALNAIGRSEESDYLLVRCGAVPEAPRITLSEVEFGSIHLDFLRMDDRGYPTIRFLIYRNSTLGQNITFIDADTYPLRFYYTYKFYDDQIEHGVEYTYTVTAVNELGESAHSNSFTAVSRRSPDPITNLTATPGDGHIDLAWDPPLFDGGGEIIEFRIKRRSGGDTFDDFTVPGNTIFYRDGLVQNGYTYQYWVTAVNIEGDSFQSSPSSARPLGAPATPGNFKARLLDGRIELEWNPTTDRGGAPFIDYVLQKLDLDGSWLELLNGSERSHVDWDIENGSSYHYRVFCYNDLWASDPTEEIIIEVPPKEDEEPSVTVDHTTSNIGLILMVGFGLFILALVASFILILAVVIIAKRHMAEEAASASEKEPTISPPTPPVFPPPPFPPMKSPGHGFILEDGPDRGFR